jgi:hypothetical protein
LSLRVSSLLHQSKFHKTIRIRPIIFISVEYLSCICF